MQRLHEKVVLITGASSGIGQACAEAFAGEGARLLLLARRAQRLEAMTDRLLELGAAAVHTLGLDVRDAKAVSASLDALPYPWSEVEVLVNNAGLSRGLEKLYEGRLEDWDEMIDTNLKGVLYLNRAIVPGMIARNRGHIVHLGSTAGEMTYPNGAVYCATKAGLKAINDGLRMDVLGTAVRVTSVDPGMVETEFSQVRFHGDEQRASKVYEGLTPLSPADVAEAIVWATTRPAHVNVAHLLLTSVDQANSLLFHRK